eukprot:4503754-Prymnesium_polylepis.1
MASRPSCWPRRTHASRSRRRGSSARSTSTSRPPSHSGSSPVSSCWGPPRTELIGHLSGLERHWEHGCCPLPCSCYVLRESPVHLRVSFGFAMGFAVRTRMNRESLIFKHSENVRRDTSLADTVTDQLIGASKQVRGMRKGGAHTRVCSAT